MNDRKPHPHAALWQGLALGMAAAAFFSVSFVLNRRMAQNEGHWAWSSSLRFLFMLPPLLAVVGLRGQWRRMLELWKRSPVGWIVWGSLGCGVFYTTLTAACALSPAWVVAATWPVAIVIGILLGPVLYHGMRGRIPRMALIYSLVIVAGVLLLQVAEFRHGLSGQVGAGLLLVLVSATAHPIGNRKSMMLLDSEENRPDSILRLTLMILGSLPLCLMLCVWGHAAAGLPSGGQLSTIGIVAAAGLIATPLFYAASDRVTRDPSALAAIESTQAAEIVFTLILEALFLNFRPPDAWGWIGLFLILGGILLHAFPGKAGHGGPG